MFSVQEWLVLHLKYSMQEWLVFYVQNKPLLRAMYFRYRTSHSCMLYFRCTTSHSCTLYTLDIILYSIACREWLIFYACTERATPACYTLDTERATPAHYTLDTERAATLARCTVHRNSEPLLHAILWIENGHALPYRTSRSCTPCCTAILRCEHTALIHVMKLEQEHVC